MQKSIVNWQDLKPRERMEHLLKTGHLSDCSFIVYDNNGQKVLIKCHKFVLMSVSPVFERMFEGDFEEAKKSDNILLDDVADVEFRKFIEYLYWHDNSRLDTYDLQTLQGLIYLSRKFLITFFMNKCLNVIKCRLSTALEADVVVDLYQYGQQIENNEITTLVISKISCKSEDYMKCDAVFNLSPNVFLKLITDLEGHVVDKDRFSLIMSYCKQKGFIKIPDPCENIIGEIDLGEDLNGLWDLTEDEDKQKDNTKISKQASTEKNSQLLNDKNSEYVESLLKTINFKSMSAYDFCAGPGASNVLSIEKKYELLSSICIIESKYHSLSINQGNSN